MNKHGQVIIIEDDVDDQDMLCIIFKRLDYKNEVVFFSGAKEALDYLSEPSINPFLILSDINMPQMSGFDLRAKIYADEKLTMKCVPFLFFTTNNTRQSVINAYQLSAQGYFVKPNSMQALEKTIRNIMEYWIDCVSP